jgi:hypothetical protein
MQVRCKKGTRKIVAGVVYEVTSLHNSSTDRNKKIYIKGFNSSYRACSFTQLDGSDLPTISWSSRTNTNVYGKFEASDIKVDDILVCQSNNYQHLIAGEKYRVVETKVKEHKYTSSGNTYKKYLVKLEGYNRFLEVNSWRFRLLDRSESRELNLNHLINGSKGTTVVDTSIRKLDLANRRESIIISALCKAAIDKNRHAMDVVDWCRNQSSRELRLDRDDFSELLNLPLGEVLKRLEAAQ